METVIDHLLFGCPDLDLGTDEIERITGVRPAYGGQHPGRGTHNALIALGERTYLEVIAPDPSQAVAPRELPYGIGTLAGPSLRAWAAAPTDLDAAAAAARAAGCELGEAELGSRATTDGGNLRWQMAKPVATESGIAVKPFLIHWGSTMHPAQVTPRGVQLVALRITTPNPDLLERQLRAIGVAVGREVSVRRGDAPALEAVLRTPSGAEAMLTS